jgi:microcystin-dependent protein
VIGKEWGGNGNLSVQGDLTIGGNFNLFPRGVIVAWNGTNPPAGWAVCNGQNGTPDLRNRFVAATGGQYNLGNTGGADQVTISIDELAPHVHGGVQNQNDCRNLRASGTGGCWMAGPMHWRNSDSTGGGKPHENRPPYYALTYIMKL